MIEREKDFIVYSEASSSEGVALFCAFSVGVCGGVCGGVLWGV